MLIEWMAGFLCRPLIPTSFSIFHIVLAGKPLVPTSTGKSQVLHPFLLQSSTNWEYFAVFRSATSSEVSSHGTVNSMTTIFLSSGADKIMSGRRVVCTMSGNTSPFSRSTFISHDLDVCSIPLRCVGDDPAVWPSLTKGIRTSFWESFLSFLLSFSRESASCLRTMSCRHLYRPCASAVWHELNMWS